MLLLTFIHSLGMEAYLLHTLYPPFPAAISNLYILQPKCKLACKPTCGYYVETKKSGMEQRAYGLPESQEDLVESRTMIQLTGGGLRTWGVG